MFLITVRQFINWLRQKKSITINTISVAKNSTTSVLQKSFHKPQKKNANIEFVADRLGHDFRYSVNDERIRSEFGWKPKYAFESAIGETIDWYRSNPEWIKISQKQVKK